MIDVLYDHEIFALQPIGGISRYYVELLPHLAAHGIAVDLFLGLHISRFPFQRDRYASVWGWRRPPRYTTRLAAPINRALFRRHARRARPQIYHATSYRDDLPTFDAPLRVVTVHDLIDSRLGKADVGSMWSVSTAAARRVEGWICISENTRRDLIDTYAVDPARTCVVHHASDLTLDARAPAPPIERPYVLHVGGRGNYKNFDAVLSAFARSPRLSKELDLACFGHAATADERACFAALAPGVRVHVIGGDDRALAAAYAHARAFVYPSLYEGFGIPLLEAMRCDCPVVASNTSCFPEIAQDAAEYFDPRDPSALAAALERVVFDDARRAELIARGQSRRAEFSWSRAAGETAAFYRQTLAAGRT